MKSKTRPISKNSQAIADSFAESLAVGHSPSKSLAPQDEALFRAFQSNLLSLISHELRTPLTGILNALGVLEAGSSDAEASSTDHGLSQQELVKMARKNAERLHQSLVSLLDLAAIESGTFHVRLREVDLRRLARGRFEASQKQVQDQGLEGQWQDDLESKSPPPLLADPQKLSQAIDLCFRILISRALPKSKIQVRLTAFTLEFLSSITPAAEQVWQSSWSQALVGIQGGMASPYSAFAGVLQSEQAFLTRVEEGLGSEFLLIHEILRLHRGQFTSSLKEGLVCMRLELPQLSSEEGLRAVLASRAYPLSTELGSVALVLVDVPKKASVAEFREEISQNLFRSTDAVYPLPMRHQLALVLNDCKNEDVPRMMNRICKTVGKKLNFGFAHCPTDNLDPGVLLDIAETRLAKKT